MNKRRRTNEASLLYILIQLAKRLSKHPYFLPIFKVVSEFLRFLFKVKVEHFILHSIIVYNFVIFLKCFAMKKRRCTYGAERFFPIRIRMFTRSSVNRNERRLINIWSVLRNRSGISYQCQHQRYILIINHYFSLNDRILISVICLARFHYKNYKNTKFLFFLPNIFPLRGSNLYPAIAISFTNKVHARI